MKKLISILIFSFGVQAMGFDKMPVRIVEERGFFSLGFAAGAAKSGLQNTNGDYSGYQTSNLGLDLDFRIWGSGAGQVSLFGSYLYGEGKNANDQSNKINNQETSVGLKLGLSSMFYLAAAAGTNKLTLSSTQTTSSLSITHTMTRVSLGLEFPVGEAFYLGFEAGYRTGPVKKSENPSLTSNTSYEGMSGLIKLVWSPPSVINSYNTKNNFR